MVNLTRLQHAAALGREQNFARAAASLHLTQPALTRSIQALERELGVRLFDRQARGTVPTAFGRLVLNHADELLARESQLRREVEKMATLEAGELRIGAGPYPARTILGPTLAELCGRSSHFKVSVVIDNTQRLEQLMMDGEIDLFVADEPDEHGQHLEVIHLKERPTVLYCRAGHPLATHRRHLLAADILRFPIGAPNPRPEQRQAARMLLEQENVNGAQRRTMLLADDISLLASIVRNSDCIGLATPEAIIDEVRLGQVVILPYHLPSVFGSRLSIVRTKGSTLAPLAGVFITALQQHDTHEFILEHSAIVAAGNGTELAEAS